MKRSRITTVKVTELQRLYTERKNDEDTLEIKGLKFVPTYLKYLLEHLTKKGHEVVFTTPEESENE